MSLDSSPLLLEERKPIFTIRECGDSSHEEITGGVDCLFGLPSGMLAGLLFGPLPGMLVGLFFALLMGNIFGLGGTLQYYLLRFWLWRAHCLPWNVPRFLEEMCGRIILLRYGGSYRFFHGLLQDYLAKLDLDGLPTSNPATTLAPSEQSTAP